MASYEHDHYGPEDLTDDIVDLILALLDDKTIRENSLEALMFDPDIDAAGIEAFFMAFEPEAKAGFIKIDDYSHVIEALNDAT